MNPGAATGSRFAVPEIDARLVARCDRSASVIDFAGATMGTTWKVRLALSPGRDQPSLQAAIEQRLDVLVAQMSHWSPTSSLALFNRARPASWSLLPPGFAAVVECGLAIAERSGGAFDPAIGRLTDLWGLGPNPIAVRPAEAAVAEALVASGWHRLARSRAWLRQPGDLWLDLSGIAKGHAVDSVADLLGAAGIEHALVEIGGECVGRGLRPDGDPWWVELETPPGFAVAPIRVALHQLAVATSGNYTRGAHTIDPRTGVPVENAPAAVSVVHRSCMTADAWATALTVLEPSAARQMCEAEDLAARILSSDGDEWLSPALVAMF